MSRVSAGARKGILPILAASLALSFAAAAPAQSKSEIEIAHAWARPTPPSATTAAIYLTIRNKGSADDTLIAASTPVAQKAALHESSVVNGIMKMAPVAAQPVKAGESLAIRPGGLHIMLTGLAHPLKQGASFPLTLTFRKAGAIGTTVAVRMTGPAGDGASQGMSRMKM